MGVEIICGEAREVLAGLPAASVHCAMTSPPYFGLRKYSDSPLEIGTEATPQEYVAHLVEVFRAVKRVLRDDGTCWIVIGDSYANDTKWGGNGSGPTSKNWTSGRGGYAGQKAKRQTGFKPKDLMMIPHRVALALQADGWVVRQELVWSKPAPMPESVQDRCTRSHETIFMLAKQERYYYDQEAIREPATMLPQRRLTQRHSARDAAMRPDRKFLYALRDEPAQEGHPAGRNKRSVWSVNTQPLGEEHYAAFPQALVTPMILAGTSEAGCCPRCLAPYRRVVERADVAKDRRSGQPWAEGIATQDNWASGTPTHSGLSNDHYRVAQTRGWEAGCSCQAGPPIPCTTLDPFLGSGTTALVSARLGRSCVGIELNPAYAAMARRRIESVPHTLFSAAVLADDGAAARRPDER